MPTINKKMTGFSIKCLNLVLAQNSTCPSLKYCHENVRYALKKKRYYLGIFPKRRTHPPLLGTPYPKKIFSVYFAF